MSRRTAWASLVAPLVLLGFAEKAAAQSRGEEASSPRSSWSATVQHAARDGSYLPLTLSPSVGPMAAHAAVLGGYNGAERAGAMQSFAEARVYGPFALRVGARLNEGGKEVGPSIGARLQLLSQAKHGVSFGAALFYKAEGFDEPEGEIESVLSISRRWNDWLFVGGIAYGQDPEGNERDGELSLAALLQLQEAVQLGLDGRARVDLGSQRARTLSSGEPTFDLDAGPLLTWALGPIALSAHAGAAVIGFADSPARGGVVALAGLGTAF
jgi:hypothetical protein